MEIIKIDELQLTDAIELIWSTFLQFEAPDYSKEGIQSFKDFINDKKILKTLEFWGAYDNNELKGVIATMITENIFVVSSLKLSITDKALAEDFGNICWRIV